MLMIQQQAARTVMYLHLASAYSRPPCKHSTTRSNRLVQNNLDSSVVPEVPEARTNGEHQCNLGPENEHTYAQQLCACKDKHILEGYWSAPRVPRTLLIQAEA